MAHSAAKTMMRGAVDVCRRAKRGDLSRSLILESHHYFPLLVKCCWLHQKHFLPCSAETGSDDNISFAYRLFEPRNISILAAQQ